MLAHRRRRRRDRVEGAREVGADDRFPIERIGFEHEGVAQDSGVVDQDVDAAELRDGEIDGRLGSRWRRDAFGEGGSPGAERLRQLGRRLRIGAVAVDAGAVIGDHHRGAGPMESLDDGAADAARATGDDGDAAGQRADALRQLRTPDSWRSNYLPELPRASSRSAGQKNGLAERPRARNKRRPVRGD